MYSGLLNAQNAVRMHSGKVPLGRVFEPDSLSTVKSTVLQVVSALPMPAGVDPAIKYRAGLHRRENMSSGPGFTSAKRSVMMPVVQAGFSGALNEGTPNDNNLAVNNDSFVVSVLNTFIRVYTTGGVFKKNWSLEFFPRDINASRPGSGVGTLDRSYDPKILFDPVANRFILVYLEGSESSDTRIIVAFSKSSNPLSGWNVYQLTGNPDGGKLWTDYPMIAINGEELFITVNILKDNTDWRDGFTQSIIWQLPKNNGYSGDTLDYNRWSNIRHNGKPVWNICPVQSAFLPGKNGLYFLSVEPGDAQNDTVYLHSISASFEKDPQYSLKVLKTDKPYGLPPYAPQPASGFRLQTNDARVLGAYFANDRIQYVQTSINPGNGRSSVYHGVLQFPDNPQPEVRGNYISYDSLDIAYPTIVCAGNAVYGRQSLITFSHTGESIFPGTSAVYYDNSGNYSDLLMVKKGEGYINSFIPDSAERWGDYTCIQRRYGSNNEYWLAGSYGKANNAVGTWVAKLGVNDPGVGLQAAGPEKQVQEVYPNPVSDVLTFSFRMQSAATVQICISDAGGRQVELLQLQTESGMQKAFLNTAALAPGLYVYTVKTGSQIIANGRFSKH